MVGSHDPRPPSRHLVSPTTRPWHVVWHSEKGVYGGSGGGTGGDWCGAMGGGEGDSIAPVTVNARSMERCSLAQLRAHAISPSFAPGHETVRWLERSARSIVCTFEMRFTSADAWPCSGSKTVRSAPPPKTCSPSAYAGYEW